MTRVRNRLFLPDIPLNTDKCYVMAVARSGCEVYIPVNFTTEEALLVRKAEIQEILNSQPRLDSPEPFRSA